MSKPGSSGSSNVPRLMCILREQSDAALNSDMVNERLSCERLTSHVTSTWFVPPKSTKLLKRTDMPSSDSTHGQQSNGSSGPPSCPGQIESSVQMVSTSVGSSSHSTSMHTCQPSVI